MDLILYTESSYRRASKLEENYRKVFTIKNLFIDEERGGVSDSEIVLASTSAILMLGLLKLTLLGSASNVVC